ncbi:WXG100-like domain-containing protein, partial [Streptomyces sp. NPDC002523]
MTIKLPSEFDWVARLTVGQAWPDGDEDRLRDFADVWHENASQMVALAESLDPATRGV